MPILLPPSCFGKTIQYRKAKKVKNVLATISSFKGISDVSKQVFEKKPTPSTTWNYIGYVLIFVAVVAVFYFVFLIIRSGAKAKLAKTEDKPQEETKV